MVRFPAAGKEIFLFSTTSTSVRLAFLFEEGGGDKEREAEDDRSSPSITNVNNACSCTFTSSNGFVLFTGAT